jgi:hypothetical protein
MRFAAEMCSGVMLCHVIHTKFHKDWPRHSKVVKVGYTDIKVISLEYFYVYFFFKLRKVG